MFSHFAVTHLCFPYLLGNSVFGGFAARFVSVWRRRVWASEKEWLKKVKIKLRLIRALNHCEYSQPAENSFLSLELWNCMRLRAFCVFCFHLQLIACISMAVRRGDSLQTLSQRTFSEYCSKCIKRIEFVLEHYSSFKSVQVRRHLKVKALWNMWLNWISRQFCATTSFRRL